MNDSYSAKSIMKFLGIVIIITIIFYFITIFVSKNRKVENKLEDEVSVIQYENILLGNIFNMNNNEFYVLVEATNDPFIDNYKTYITTYKEKDGALAFYYVDLNSAFNKRYISDTDSFEKDDIRVKGTTLLKVVDNEVEESYTDSNSIKEKLEEISS